MLEGKEDVRIGRYRVNYYTITVPDEDAARAARITVL
jgi:hypothetical protein